MCVGGGGAVLRKDISVSYLEVVALYTAAIRSCRRSIIGERWVEGGIFIYSCLQTLKRLTSKKNYVAEREYMSICPLTYRPYAAPSCHWLHLWVGNDLPRSFSIYNKHNEKQ